MTFAGLSMFDFDLVETGRPKRFSIRGSEVFSDLVAGVLSATTKEKIGTVSEVLRSKSGNIEFLAIDLGFKQVLLSNNRFWISQQENCIYASGLSREQAISLPEFKKQTQSMD
jgi:hypothetical protein